MSRFLYRLGRFAVRRRWQVLGVWLLALMVLGVGGSLLGGETANDFTIPGTETQRAADLLTKRFPAESGAMARVVVSVDQGRLTDPAVKTGIADLLAETRKQPHVVSVSPLVTPQMLGLAADSRVAFASVQYDQSTPKLGTAAAKRLQRGAEALRHTGVHVDFGGELQFSGQELGSTSEVIGLIVAVFVLLVAFGSVVAMGLPLVAALLGLGAGLSLVTIGSSFLTIPTVAPTLAAMIGLGVGIDYALFIVTRHREHLRQGMTVEESAGRAIATVGQAVLFAGITVVIAICGLQLVGIPLVAMMGYATAAVVLVSVAAALTLLPALLGFAGHAIDKLKIPFVKRARCDRPARLRIALVRPCRSPSQAVRGRQPAAARHVDGAVLLHPPRSDRCRQRSRSAPPRARHTTGCQRASARGSTARSRSRSISARPIPMPCCPDSSVASPPIATWRSRCRADHQRERRHRASSPCSPSLAAGRAYAGAGPPVAVRHRPGCGEDTGRAGGLRRGRDGGVHRHLRQDRFAPPRVHRRGAGAVLPAADGGVPIDPGAAQGRAAQPARHRRRRTA